MKFFLGHVGCQIRHMFKKEDEGIVKLGCQVGLLVGHGLERGQGQGQGQGSSEESRTRDRAGPGPGPGIQSGV